MKIGRKEIIPLLIMVGIFIMIILIRFAKPKEEINWKPSYEKNSTEPYGGLAVFELLAEIFPQQNIDATRLSLYEMCNDSLGSFNYIIINQNFLSNKLDTEKLFDFIENGGEVFIAAERFQGELVREYGIETSNNIFLSDDSLSLRFVPTKMNPDKYYPYKQHSVPYYFEEFNNLACKVLAENSKDEAILLQIERGKGNIYLCSTPIAFTNYNLLLNDNREFISKSFSLMPNRTTYWDEYYKIGRIGIGSPWRFVLSVPALRWALYLAIFGVILFTLFEAKRKQRIVPIIKPPANTTLEFTRTIGRLYFQRRNHKNIAEKKITYFLEYIREYFYLRTAQLDESFIQQLAAKSSNDLDKTKNLINYIKHLQNKSSTSEKELTFLSKQIDEFKMQGITQ